GVAVILLVAGASLWRFCRSGQFPTPSPFPNYNRNYLEEKYGVPRTSRQKVPLTSNPPALGTYVAYSTSNCQLELMDDLAELPTAADMILSQRSSLTRHNSLALSVSVESMDSLSSVGQEPWADPCSGQLEVVLEALSCPPRLSVTLLQGIELQGLTEEDQGKACFVTVVLEPGSQVIGTTVHQGTLAVTFNECFLVALDLRMNDDAVLRFDVSVIPRESEQALPAGSAELHVSGLDLSATPFSTWLYLQDSSQVWRIIGTITRIDDILINVLWNMLSTLRKPVAMWHPLRLSN
uniref:C2 domain-containing protein n=1 Tax=Eptatretus burgeri TaxID=7764 RepID=A0A8C4QV49_EPTBU